MTRRQETVRTVGGLNGSNKDITPETGTTRETDFKRRVSRTELLSSKFGVECRRRSKRTWWSLSSEDIDER